MEIPPLSVSFYIEIAMECQPWSSRNKSMFEVLSIIAQAVWTVRQENRQGSLAYFQPVGPARTWARPRRNSISPIRSRCGSKNTGSCFRFVSSCSRVQRFGVHRRHRRWQGARPMRYRTDRGKSKRDRFLAAPQNGRRRKAFSPFKGLRSAERKRKRNHLPTGEVRPSEHDNDF